MREYLDALRIVADLGGTVLIAVTLVVCGYRFVGQCAKNFVDAHEKLATAMTDQARNLADLKPALERMATKDNLEHREILLGLQVVGDELKSLVCEMKSLREERRNERSGQSET